MCGILQILDGAANMSAADIGGNCQQNMVNLLLLAF